ncbi:unnamed protein product [Calypogeia fissa]
MAILTPTVSAAASANASVARLQLPSLTPTSQFRTRWTSQRQWSSCGSTRHGAEKLGTRAPRRRTRRSSSLVAMAALPDPHAFAVLAMDMVNLTDLPVRVDLDPTREIITERSVWKLSEEAIKTFYMVASMVFCWGCCVFGSMNDVFYDSEEYRKAGGNGTGHWIYEQMEREERAARDEIWGEDLIKEIEEKAEEVRRGEEEKEKDLELV